MDNTRNATVIKKELTKYISSLGVDVNLKTKARGNKGFFKNGRIDISKNLNDEDSIKILLHEFAHYVNFLLDEKLKNFYVLFKTDDNSLKKELLEVTYYVDENSLCEKLISERGKLNISIKNSVKKIKDAYPDFKQNEKFKPFRNYARWSNLAYLEKHDRVRVFSLFSRKVYSVAEVKKDFPDIPEVFVEYLKLKSDERKRARITRKISKLNKYYSEPCELFARFIEGVYLDSDNIKAIAPQTYSRFVELYNEDYYKCLRDVFDILGVKF